MRNWLVNCYNSISQPRFAERARASTCEMQNRTCYERFYLRIERSAFRGGALGAYGVLPVAHVFGAGSLLPAKERLGRTADELAEAGIEKRAVPAGWVNLALLRCAELPQRACGVLGAGLGFFEGVARGAPRAELMQRRAAFFTASAQSALDGAALAVCIGTGAVAVAFQACAVGMGMLIGLIYGVAEAWVTYEQELSAGPVLLKELTERLKTVVTFDEFYLLMRAAGRALIGFSRTRLTSDFLRVYDEISKRFEESRRNGLS